MPYELVSTYTVVGREARENALARRRGGIGDGILDRRLDALLQCSLYVSALAKSEWDEIRLGTYPMSIPLTSDDPDGKKKAIEATRFHLMARLLRGFSVSPDGFNLDWEWNPTPRFFFRVSGPESHTFYDKEVGFVSQRVLSGGAAAASSDPTPDDFVAHMDGKRRSNGEEFKTPWVSLTESPYRALRFAKSRVFASPSKTKVYVIETPRLLVKNVKVRRSTDIYIQFGNRHMVEQGRFPMSQFVLGSHWLALGWIPTDCVFTGFALDKFEDLCRANGIIVNDAGKRPNHAMVDKKLDPKTVYTHVSVDISHFYRGEVTERSATRKAATVRDAHGL